MKIVIFGLTISSSWGNGHATIWRGLCRNLSRRGHEIVFFERDVPYYASHRDMSELSGGELVLYPDWKSAFAAAEQRLAAADVGIVTSYCPDALEATDLVLSSGTFRVFYDLDSPVTLDRLGKGEDVPYIGPGGLAGFDLVLSYTGGAAMDALRERLGAGRVAPLYGSVDPEVHRPVAVEAENVVDLSYLGTYSGDRQDALEMLLVKPARQLPGRRFVIGGSLYPDNFPWTTNIHFKRHVPPPEHSRFYCSSRLTLNVTRAAMARMGYCPSGRLFEAAACGVPVLSDSWNGLETFFEPGREILIARSTEEAVSILKLPPENVAAVGRAARRRALAAHTAEKRSRDLEEILKSAGA
jgi:spore maturation protein CgeB